MARKERNNVDYFPHAVTHGRKMFYLRAKYKNDGYSVWFMLLEHLGKAEYHYIDLSESTQVMYLSSEFMVDEGILLEIIDILVHFGEFDKDLWEHHKILFNQKFIENIVDAYKKRNNQCIDRNALVIILESKGVLNEPIGYPYKGLSALKGTGNTQSKEEYSKEKETIVDKTKVLLSESPEGDQTDKPKKRNVWIETFDKRKDEFRKSLFPYTNYKSYKGPYTPDMVKEFFDYWTEPNKSRSRMRWETEKTWDLTKRLANWSKNDFTGKKAAAEESNIYVRPKNLIEQ